MQFRSIALAALALALVLPAAPVAAEDDLVRQLVNACVGCRFPKDLRGRDLHGLSFVGADLRGVDLSRANLNGASFTGTDLRDARFDDADLRNVRFTGVRFGNTSMAHAKLDNITMEGVQLDGRSIVGADYRSFVRTCTGCDLRETKLSAAERALREVALHPPAIPPDVVRQLRDIERERRLHPPAISADVERAMRNAERALRDVEREMRLRPPITPELRQRLREIESRQFMVPPLPAIPPVPATAPIPTVPLMPSVNPGTPAAAPAPPAQQRGVSVRGGGTAALQ